MKDGCEWGKGIGHGISGGVVEVSFMCRLYMIFISSCDAGGGPTSFITSKFSRPTVSTVVESESMASKDFLFSQSICPPKPQTSIGLG